MIGLMTAREFLKATMEIEEMGEEEVAGPTNGEIKKERKKLRKKKMAKKKMAKKKMASRLSFMDNDPGNEAKEEEEAVTETVVLKKDPTVDTSFLPDQQRDQESQKERKDWNWIGRNDKMPFKRRLWKLRIIIGMIQCINEPLLSPKALQLAIFSNKFVKICVVNSKS
jgi:protein FAM50